MDGQQNVPQQPDEPSWQFKPGETISPRAQQTTTNVADPNPLPAAPASLPVTPLASTVPVVPQEQLPPTPVTTPQVVPAESQALPQQPLPVQPLDQPVQQEESVWRDNPDETVSWTASEFIAHNKTAGWHMMLVAASIVLAVIVWFLFKDVLSALVVVIAGIILSFYGARKPQQLQYQLSTNGISVGPKHFAYEDFTAFSIAPEGAFSSITLVPSKRFAPLLSLYYDPQDEDRILDVLGAFLPQQEHHTDAVDAFMKRIRF